jgi:hypothetical protein
VRYTAIKVVADDARIQLNPVKMAPAASNNLGPNFSIKKPCSGDKNVCSTMKMEKVTCSCDS